MKKIKEELEKICKENELDIKMFDSILSILIEEGKEKEKTSKEIEELKKVKENIDKEKNEYDEKIKKYEEEKKELSDKYTELKMEYINRFEGSEKGKDKSKSNSGEDEEIAPEDIKLDDLFKEE